MGEWKWLIAGNGKGDIQRSVQCGASMISLRGYLWLVDMDLQVRRFNRSR